MEPRGVCRGECQARFALIALEKPCCPDGSFSGQGGDPLAFVPAAGRSGWASGTRGRQLGGPLSLSRHRTVVWSAGAATVRAAGSAVTVWRGEAAPRWPAGFTLAMGKRPKKDSARAASAKRRPQPQSPAPAPPEDAGQPRATGTETAAERGDGAAAPTTVTDGRLAAAREGQAQELIGNVTEEYVKSGKPYWELDLDLENIQDFPGPDWPEPDEAEDMRREALGEHAVSVEDHDFDDATPELIEKNTQQMDRTPSSYMKVVLEQLKNREVITQATSKEATEIDADVIARHRLPPGMRLLEVVSQARQRLVRDTDRKEMEEAAPHWSLNGGGSGSGSSSSAAEGAPVKSLSDQLLVDEELAVALNRVAAHGLELDGIHFVVVNRHYFDFRFLYGLTALKISVGTRGERDEELQLEMLRARLMLALRIADQPMARALRQCEALLRAVLEQPDVRSETQLVELVERVLSPLDTMHAAAFWLVVHAALAAWQRRRQRHPKSVNETVVYGLMAVRNALLRSSRLRTQLPREYLLLGEVFATGAAVEDGGNETAAEMAAATDDEDARVIQRVTRDSTDDVIINIGALSAFLTARQAHAYGPLAQMVTDVYDTMRSARYDIPSPLDDLWPLISDDDIPLPEGTTKSIFNKVRDIDVW
ncbi:hypothetical protein CDCA_CDCA02G0609 [Cyanidium caldarium]|uniref:Uncharacterized protein n=1 Tax=Cyanidium caldarium TaxID=2771 RepID=A0AAV9IQI5_CYACA|nr:hypothetical protein CDCA_CDCA02G0609 [Cyanidium caldarium]